MSSQRVEELIDSLPPDMRVDIYCKKQPLTCGCL